MSRGQPVHIKAGKVDVRRQKKWDRKLTLKEQLDKVRGKK